MFSRRTTPAERPADYRTRAQMRGEIKWNSSTDLDDWLNGKTSEGDRVQDIRDSVGCMGGDDQREGSGGSISNRDEWSVN